MVEQHIIGKSKGTYCIVKISPSKDKILHSGFKTVAEAREKADSLEIVLTPNPYIFGA